MFCNLQEKIVVVTYSSRWCLKIGEALVMMLKKNFQEVIIDSDSQVVMNAIYSKVSVRRDIILVEVIANVCFILRKLVLVIVPECDR